MSRLKTAVKAALDAAGLWSVLRYAQPKYHRPLGRLALARAGNFAAPSAASRESLALAYAEFGRLQLACDLLHEAVASCDKALSASRDCALAYFARGRARRLLGFRREACEDFKRAAELGLEPAALRASACAAVAEGLLMNFDDPESLEAVGRWCGKAIELDCEQPDYYVLAGHALRYAGKTAQSEAMWASGIEMQRSLAQRRGLDRLGRRIIGGTWLASLGNTACLDFYLKMRHLQPRPQGKPVVVASKGSPASRLTLVGLWESEIELIESAAALGLSDQDARLLQDDIWAVAGLDGRPRSFFPAALGVQRRWEAEGRPPLLRLPDELRARGRALLKELGLPAGAWFVCLHVREPGYWKSIDLDHPTVRDADIDTYLDAVRAITERGGWVVRIGDSSMKPLPPMERVVDFAHHPLKSEWMDVFLCADCRFFVGTASGPCAVAPAFGVPAALTNWTPVGHLMWYKNIIGITKLFWSSEQRRHLSIAELFALGLGYQEYRRPYERAGVSVRDNTPEEIKELVLEMLERLEGRAAYAAEDQRRHEDYHRALAEHDGIPAGRLGRDFLRRHEFLVAAGASVDAAV